MRVRIISKRWYTPPCGGYSGITLYPFIFIKPPWSERLLRHELIHCYQVRRDGWWRFYVGYLWRKIRGTAYRAEPSEVEAYENQFDPDFLPDELESLVYAREPSE